LVQWKPIRSSPRKARKKPSGSNQGAVFEVAEGEGALLGVVGEGGGVHREPRRLVPPGDERADAHALREHRVRQVEAGQRAPHLAQFAEQGQPEDLRKVPGGGVPAVRPHPQPLAGGGEQRSAQRPPVALSAPPRVDDQLGGGRLHRVGVLQLRVAGQFAVHGEQQVRDAVPRAAAQVQPALFGHGLLTVPPGGLGEQREDRLGLLAGEGGVRLDRAGAAEPRDVVAGHAYEGKGRGGCYGGRE
jgi:hypothetical protein